MQHVSSFPKSHRRLVSLIIGMATLCIGAAAFAAIASGTPTTAASMQATSTTLTVNKPTVATGDLMIASIAVHGGTEAAVISAPSGWTLIASTTNDTNIALLSYYKYAGASEPSDYSWQFTGQTTAEGAITPYAGAATASPVDAVASNTGYGTSATTTSITTTGTKELIVSLFAADIGQSLNAGAYFSTPTGMTEKADTTNTPYGPSIAVDEMLQTSAGSTGSKTSTITGGLARYWATQQVALKFRSLIQFDSSIGGNPTGSGAGPYTLSFTNTAGNFVVVAYRQAKLVTDAVTSMTYGGVTCNQVEYIAGFTASNDRNYSLWACPDAPTGTNDLSVSYAASTDGGNDGGLAILASYSNVATSSQPDTHGQSYAASSGTTYSGTLSSSATDGDWMVSTYYMAPQVPTMSAGSDTTLREQYYYVGLVDSNGPVGNAGSSWTTNVTGSNSANGRLQMSMMLSPL